MSLVLESYSSLVASPIVHPTMALQAGGPPDALLISSHAVNVDDHVVVFRVELRCLACARILGTLETRRWPCIGPAVLDIPGTISPVSVADWSRLRCATCGGNAYADEVRTVRLYPPVAWDDLEAPRRGRPPSWLVAQRQAARDPDEQSASS
ncbi:MAG TPA: hypothetical protein VFG86_05475 [Chloroflexota bacterium]|jgi:hypothetical protein|nr:hypothetical protein [Chloroflexota bacterium]